MRRRAGIFFIVLFLISHAVAGEGTTGYIGSQMANIRSGPGTQHAVLLTYVRGDAVNIVGEQTEWYQLQLPEGKTGWVRKNLVTFQKTKKTETAVSFPSLAEKGPPWMNIFREHYGDTIVFRDGVVVDKEKFRLVDPAPVKVDQINVQRIYNLRGEELFSVECTVKGESYLNLLSEDISFYLQAIIFQKDPGPYLKGNWIVWLGATALDPVRSGSREHVVLENSSHFQNCALRDKGVLVIMVYAQGVQYRKGEIPPSEYYIVGAAQSSFKLK